MSKSQSEGQEITRDQLRTVFFYFVEMMANVGMFPALDAIRSQLAFAIEAADELAAKIYGGKISPELSVAIINKIIELKGPKCTVIGIELREVLRAEQVLDEEAAKAAKAQSKRKKKP